MAWPPPSGSMQTRGPGLRGRNAFGSPRVWWRDQSSNPHRTGKWPCDHGELFTTSVPQPPLRGSRDNDGSPLRGLRRDLKQLIHGKRVAWYLAYGEHQVFYYCYYFFKKSQNSSPGPRKPFVGNKKHRWLPGAYKPEQRSPRGGKIPTYCNFLL